MSDFGFVPLVPTPKGEKTPESNLADKNSVNDSVISGNVLIGTEQLYNAMVISDAVALPQTLMFEMYRDPHLCNRRHSVEWMRKVLTAESIDVRDTAVRIFDTYLAVSFADNQLILKDTSFVAFTAVAAMILSSKLHSSTNYLSPSWFSAFNTEDVLFFERQIVLKIGSRLSTLASPSFFVDFVLSLCPEKVEKKLLQTMVNSLIGEFWEDGASLLFAPSTIAISAVVVTLSLKKVDCSKLVDSLPEFLLPDRAYPFFLEEAGKSMYLDLNTCMKAMERLPFIRAAYMTRSPTSVVDEVEKN